MGMDETSARRGHDYVTLFVDMEEKITLFVTEGKRNESVKFFVTDLQQHGRDANPILKDSRFVFLKNQSNYTDKQKEKYQQISMSTLNVKTFKSLQM